MKLNSCFQLSPFTSAGRQACSPAFEADLAFLSKPLVSLLSADIIHLPLPQDARLAAPTYQPNTFTPPQDAKFVAFTDQPNTFTPPPLEILLC